MATKDKTKLADSLILSAAGLKTAATIGKTINDYGYLSYLAVKTEGDVKIAEAVNTLDERAIAQNAAEQIAGVQREFNQTAGKQAVAAAASGIDSGSGYVNDLLLDSAKQADKDMTAIMYNAQGLIDKKRLQLSLMKIASKYDAQKIKAQQDSTIAAGIINSAVNIFDGVGAVAAKWYKTDTTEKTTAGKE